MNNSNSKKNEEEKNTKKKNNNDTKQKEAEEDTKNKNTAPDDTKQKDEELETPSVVYPRAPLLSQPLLYGQSPHLNYAQKLERFREQRKRFFHTLLVLLWKHGKVRMKRFIVTPLEFAIPGIFILALAVVIPIFDTNLSSKIIESEKPLHLLVSPQLVLYTPENIFTSALMRKAGYNLLLQRILFFPNSTTRGYYGFSKYTQRIVTLVKQLNSRSALVIFQVVTEELNKIPHTLNYTIRIRRNIIEGLFPESVVRKRYKSHMGTNKLNRSRKSGGVAQLYMRIQWAIDSSFIKLLAEQEKEVSRRHLVDKIQFPVVYVTQYANHSRRESLFQLLITLLRYIGFLSLILPFTILMMTLMNERSSGIQELMKQAGVTYSVWACSHGINMIYNGFFYAIIGTLVLYLRDTETMFMTTNGLFIFICLWLYFHSVLSFTFPLSFLSKTGDYGAAISIIMYIIIFIPSNMLWNEEHGTITHILTGFFPHVPANWFYKELVHMESKLLAIEARNFIKAHTHYGLSAFLTYLYMIMQIVLNMLFATYLSNVAPGRYGVKKPYNYLWKKEVEGVEFVLKETYAEKMKRGKRYFETCNRPPSYIGIYVDHVSKVFANNVVLSNLTFPVYKGEITILLGHNGAGKTTLMSIITGMLSPTLGRIFLNGKDIEKDRYDIHNTVAMCPQHNLFFPYLSCRDHVRFYAMLKGVTFRQSKLDATYLLTRLGLGDKQTYESVYLSGGQKRRLQLACALTGDSEILILDEPTAGLDVETRRTIWDMLSNLRGTRTVLLSTNMMEEADALGDRVVALHRGRLRGNATPMYLKRNIGSGYRLSFTTDGFPKKEEITRAVQSIIPSATLKQTTYNSLSYNLPAQDSDKFPQLFTKLEGDRDQLKIATIGVGVSSFEEVFLMLCSDVQTTFSDESDGAKAKEHVYQKQQGRPLYRRQMWVLLKRHYWYIMANKLTFMIFQVILPIFIMAGIVFMFVAVEPTKLSEMSAKERITKPNVLHQLNTDNAFEGVKKSYHDVAFWSAKNVSEAIHYASNYQLLKGTELSPLNHYLIGVDFNDQYANVYYSKLVKHVAPVALNLLSNVLATKLLKSATGRTITTHNVPLVRQYKKPMAMENLYPAIFLLLSMVFGTVLYCVGLMTLERESGARQIHLMSGCPPAIIWVTALLFHTSLYTVISVIPATIVLVLDLSGTLSQGLYMLVFFTILLIGLIASILFYYSLSFCLTHKKFGVTLIVMNVVTGLIPGILMHRMSQDEGDYFILIKVYILTFYYICPIATTMTAVLQATHIARLNQFCNINLSLCPKSFLDVSVEVEDLFPGFNTKSCCDNMKGSVPYISSNSNAAGWAIWLLFWQIIMYTMLLLLMQYGIFNGLKDRLTNCLYQPLRRQYNNENVNAEMSYVDREIRDPYLNNGRDALLVSNIHKKYPYIIGKSVNALRGIDFSVKRGECFGLLGVNGAGKTTTFKIITTEEVPTKGKIFANGYFLKWPRTEEYIKSLGYCPQFSGLDEFMTGRQNLNLLLVLRGLSDEDVNTETEAWIKIVGLEGLHEQLIATYSGGCKRRLATACALSSGGAVTLLDEPTSGVDVSARRRVWVALKKGLQSDRSVIISSHNMDEMEALCNRIAILAAGEIGAFGSVPQLRAEHASGHALNIKTKLGAERTADNMQKLKAAVEKLFGSTTLGDEHGTMLHYQINQPMHYSELFTKLEGLKKAHPIIEDYSVTETTLEEVFLSFARPRPNQRVTPGTATSNDAT